MLRNPKIQRPGNGKIRVHTGSAPPWNVIKREKNVEYRGQFTVFDPSGKPIVRVAGRVVEWPGLPTDVYLFNPPKEFRLHPHGRCLQLVRPDARWFKMHFERPARTFDQARAYIEQVLSEAVRAPAAQPRVVEAPQAEPARAEETGDSNAPTLQYKRRHHWIWILRRLRPMVGLAGILMTGSLIMTMLSLVNAHAYLSLITQGATIFFSIRPIFRLALVLFDWYWRSIRLYSDGRLEYRRGFRGLDCRTTSMRFGSMSYSYSEIIGVWLNCANIELPFNGGTIEAIPDFRRFWEIAQGRL